MTVPLTARWHCQAGEEQVELFGSANTAWVASRALPGRLYVMKEAQRPLLYRAGPCVPNGKYVCDDSASAALHLNITHFNFVLYVSALLSVSVCFSY